MSTTILRELYDNKAFKPAPSLWELAEAHVPFGDLGVPNAPEPVVRSGLLETDGLVMLVGSSGSGKSSVLAHVMAQLATERTGGDSPRRYLPIVVPVAGRPHAADLDAFGKAAMREVLLALKNSLPREYRERLERAMAKEVAIQHAGQKFNAKVAAKVFGVGPEVGYELGGDVTTVIGSSALDNRGGIKTLGDICRARDTELLIAVEDTDGWARSSPDDARRFFGSIGRPLVSDVDVAVVVAVQTPWLKEPGLVLPEVEDLRQRAVSVANIETPDSDERAAEVMAAILDRRIRRAVASPDALPEDVTRAVFAEDALLMLGHTLRANGSIREPLACIRDALDRHADGLPDQVERTHLLDAL